MPVKLNELQQAASRYQAHMDALEKAKQEKPEAIYSEQTATAIRHRALFVPPSERLTQARTTAIAMQANNLPPETITAVIDAPAPEVQPLLEIVDIVPEIALRDNDLRPIRFLQLAQLAAMAVGRIQISDGPSTEEGDATGFLIAPNLLMTNWHVLKTKDFAAAAASIVFDDEEDLNGQPKDTKIFRLLPEQIFVSDKELDYAIVAVDSRTVAGVALSMFGYLRLFEATGKLDPTQRQAANIIQHPKGGRKKIALRDNYVEEVLPNGADPAKKLNSLYYGTDTLKGSSGAPVCSDQWFVVALHRGGVPKTKDINNDGKPVALRLDGSPAHEGDPQELIHYITNEGTRISRIIHSLREKSNTDSNADGALKQITTVATDPKFGPINIVTPPIVLPGPLLYQDGGPEEITRRDKDTYDAAEGYNPDFLGTRFRIQLPKMTSEIKRELAPLKNSNDTELKYINYSIHMNRERRTAFYAACNIDGSRLWGVQGNGALPKRPAWTFDPRLEDHFQPDDVIFSTALQRGHLFKREDAIWGPNTTTMIEADKHSFTITNATPMIANFNNVEWGDLEDLVTRECEAGNRVSYFAGPIFRSTDPYFNELRKHPPNGELRRGMRVPQAFWKIVAWIEENKLASAGFILYQTDEIVRHGPIVEEINFGSYRKTPIVRIEQMTGLRFPELLRIDTYQS